MSIVFWTWAGLLLSQAAPTSAPPSAPASVEAAARQAYAAMSPAQVSAHRLPAAPSFPRGFIPVDVSEKIRSASFGHRTWLWIPKGPKPSIFYVHFSRSTNSSEATFGPFPLHTPAGVRAAEGAPPKASERAQTCGAATCAAGEVCCNASCGICAAPGAACIQQVCDAAPPSR